MLLELIEAWRWLWLAGNWLRLSRTIVRLSRARVQ
jgi:hypothetical protein